jgi:hypothetical protein
MVDAPALRGVNKVAFQKAIQSHLLQLQLYQDHKNADGLASAIKHSNETIVGRHVCFWHKADIKRVTINIRYWG